MILQATATGEQHGLIGVLPNSVPFDDFKNMKPEYAERMRKKKKDDERMVDVEYINHDEKNGRLYKPYCRYAGEQIQLWNFIAGYQYKVPMGLVEEVNAMRTPVRSGLQSVDGKDINRNGVPLEKDTFERTHQLIPTSFR
jgi:hypothetical protein